MKLNCIKTVLCMIIAALSIELKVEIYIENIISPNVAVAVSMRGCCSRCVQVRSKEFILEIKFLLLLLWVKNNIFIL